MIKSDIGIENDILYITEQTKNELLQYCEDKLIDSVFKDFSRNGKIIDKKKDGTPSRYWIITNYFNVNTGISKKCKLAVILSMSAIGGIIQIGEERVTSWEKVLQFMKSMSLIDNSELGYFFDAFFKLKQGQGVIFTLNIDND